MAHTWGRLADALALGLTREGISTAGLRGDIRGRIIKRNGTADNLPPEYWNGTVDWAGSQILPLSNIEIRPGGYSMTVARWLTVELDHRSVREHFGLDQQPAPRRAGGRTPTIPPQALIEVGAWLAAHGIPDKLVEVEDKLREAISVAGTRELAEKLAESTIRTWASRIVETHRRALK
jgi:hypothetical protein